MYSSHDVHAFFFFFLLNAQHPWHNEGKETSSHELRRSYIPTQYILQKLSEFERMVRAPRTHTDEMGLMREVLGMDLRASDRARAAATHVPPLLEPRPGPAAGLLRGASSVCVCFSSLCG
jgi:hypothetical protein